MHHPESKCITVSAAAAASATSSSSMPACSSKVLDVSGMDIVFRGKPWEYPEDPSAKSVVHLLERNESIVTWLQPRGGSVTDQIPAINVNGQYRGLSLRMQKSIWRHIRLKKGFVNLENLSQVNLERCVITNMYLFKGTPADTGKWIPCHWQHVSNRARAATSGDCNDV